MATPMQRDHLRQFLILVFALLIPCFGIWWVASALLALPVTGFVNTVLTLWFPDVVQALYTDGSDTLLMTEFGDRDGVLIPLDQAEYRLGFPVDTRLLSYSIPFYSALHFATPRSDGYLNSWVWGVVILYPLFALGMLTICLKQLMTGLGVHFLDQTGVWVPDANLIALSYQLSVLIVPTVAPILLWLWQGRNTVLLKDVLSRLDNKPAGDS